MWTKVGEGSAEDAVVSTEEFVHHRRITSADAPVLDSHLAAEPGHRLLLAWHAPAELEPGRSNGVPPRGGTPCPPGRSRRAKR